MSPHPDLVLFLIRSRPVEWKIGLICLALFLVVCQALTLSRGGWAGTRAMIQDNLAAGTGPGTYAIAFPQYQAPGYARLPRYAHSDFLQFPAETLLFTALAGAGLRD